MNSVYVYIATKSSSDVYVPPPPKDLVTLGRDVSDAFYALQGGYLRVGELRLFPVQRSVPYHLLCDGKEVSKKAFPELFSFLSDSQGTATDPEKFVLPDFTSGIVPAPTPEPETVASNTVTSETPTSGTGQSGGSEDYAVDSGASYIDWSTFIWPY